MYGYNIPDEKIKSMVKEADEKGKNDLKLTEGEWRVILFFLLLLLGIWLSHAISIIYSVVICLISFVIFKIKY